MEIGIRTIKAILDIDEWVRGEDNLYTNTDYPYTLTINYTDETLLQEDLDGNVITKVSFKDAYDLLLDILVYDVSDTPF